MSQDEIIEMAQECGLVGMRPHLDGIYVESLVAFSKLVEEKALAQQEPVIDKSAAIKIATSLCWEPKRKPLSAEQVSEICAEWTDENGNTGSFGRRQIARAIEQAHGIKENT